jgi:DHA1 family inner membrane transport protein
LTELGALKRGQVWLTLGIAAIGFGGVFAVYSYITPMLTHVTGMAEARVPLVLSVIGVGMVAGSLFGGWLADRGVMRAIWITLVLNVIALGLIPFTAPHTVAVTINMLFVGFAALAMGPALQTRLMDIAADAQALAAALNHSAFNLANALGAWLGGVAIAAGLGWTSTGPIGAALALCGLAIWFAAWRTRQDRAPIAAPC